MQDADRDVASEPGESQEELLRRAISASRAVAAGTLFAHAAHDMGHGLTLQQTRLLSRPLLAQRPRQLHAGQLITPLAQDRVRGEQDGGGGEGGRGRKGKCLKKPKRDGNSSQQHWDWGGDLDSVRMNLRMCP